MYRLSQLFDPEGNRRMNKRQMIEVSVVEHKPERKVAECLCPGRDQQPEQAQVFLEPAF